MVNEIYRAAESAASELIDRAGLRQGQIVVVGCSTSEVIGRNIGTDSNVEVGKAIFDALARVFSKQGVFIAAQCCEHLNRALIVEREAARGYEVVNAVPIPKAGGAFAFAAYSSFSKPVALERIYADAGLDIGGTLIGMHLKRVAVPLRLETSKIGQAGIIAARTRLPLIGGSRTVYDETLY